MKLSKFFLSLLLSFTPFSGLRTAYNTPIIITLPKQMVLPGVWQGEAVGLVPNTLATWTLNIDIYIATNDTTWVLVATKATTKKSVSALYFGNKGDIFRIVFTVFVPGGNSIIIEKFDQI